MLTYTKDDKITAYLQAVEIKNPKYLPNSEKFAMNLIDLTEFDFINQTGNVNMIDLNYDFHIHSIIQVKKNKILSWETKEFPAEILLKYKNIRVKASNRIKSSLLCDSNNDNNLSFSECYKCLSDAISANGFSTFVCDFPVIGWSSCWGSKGAACVYLSSIY